MVMAEDKVSFLSSKKKIEFLQAASSSPENSPQIVLITRDKGDDAPGIQKMIDAVKASKNGSKIGCFMKDPFKGNFMDAWKSALKKNNLESIDIASSFAKAVAPKDEAELALIQKACQASCEVYLKLVKGSLVDMIESEKKVKHSKLASQIEDATTNKKYLPSGVVPDNSESCFPPIVQSGGNYSLKFSAQR